MTLPSSVPLECPREAGRAQPCLPCDFPLMASPGSGAHPGCGQIREGVWRGDRKSGGNPQWLTSRPSTPIQH